MIKIKTAAVIGAGVMGAAIAAHLANAGIRTVLLDIVPDRTPDDRQKAPAPESSEFRNRLARNGLERALKSSPASFYVPEDTKLITTGNIEDHLDWLTESDWVVEAIIENLELKHNLLRLIVPYLHPEAVLSTNTSGIPVSSIAAALPDDVAARFLGTHFFNPPRYMKLLEIIPCSATRPEIVRSMSEFGEKILGKGIVLAKDTPNFIANRIGTFSLMVAVRNMIDLGLTPEEVDQLTGPAIGHPKSATFRTADLVGLDTLCHVAKNVFDGAPHDEQRDVFAIPALLEAMLSDNLLGEKTGQGFYQKTRTPAGTVILSLDPETRTYRERKKVSFPSLTKTKTMDSLDQRLKTLFYANDQAGAFCFQTTAALLIYSAHRIPEISDDIAGIDRALKWGFGWEMGPFEVWDALGLEQSIEKMEAGGYTVPAWIRNMVDSGKSRFYRKEKGAVFAYDPTSESYVLLEEKPEIVYLPALKDQGRAIRQNPDASLVDLGDGVACLEFHTKMNALTPGIGTMIQESMQIVAEGFDGMVMANHGTHFSVGANLLMLMLQAQEKKFDEIREMLQAFQNILQSMKFFEKPVVAAPAGMALGGGSEICLHAARVRAAAETYMGLVETGVGLIPAGGGCKELLCRATENLFEVGKGGVYPRQIELKPFVARAFENIALAKVSSSAKEARKIGFLRPWDGITINRDHLIDEAKRLVRALVLEGYRPPIPRDDIRVMGRDGLAVFDYAAYVMHQAGYISEYDRHVAGRLARVLCGGDVMPDTLVTEDYILELERENFLSLCGEPKTLARIQHMLMTGKPLRN